MSTVSPSDNLNILMQNRSSAQTQPGGDTVVMEKTAAGLRAKGIKVTIDLAGSENPANYDLVHLFNFAIPEMVQSFGQRAKQAGVPFVVTTLYEDIPTFHNQSITTANALKDYAARGQNQEGWRKTWPRPWSVTGCAKFDNSWAVQNAAALLVSGPSESSVLGRDYSQAGKCTWVPFGFDRIDGASATQFEKEYGVRDFILCVGRAESRKNQLMLLKAMENSDLPLVFACGGFSYQPEYLEAMRKFKRKGQTLFLERLRPEMLASAYSAARVHCLPSWYELPGLVSLEAGYYGCNLAVTDTGTTRDYLGDLAFYCEPWSADSVLNAVMAAYHSPINPLLKPHIQQFTWERTIEQTLTVYNNVAAQQGRIKAATWQAPQISSAATTPSNTSLPAQDDFITWLERGEKAAEEHQFEEAQRCLDQAEKMNPNSVRMMRAKAAVNLVQGKVSDAQAYFEKAKQSDPRDAKAWCGLGMCRLSSNDVPAAYNAFVESIDCDPYSLVAIQNLIRCSYSLNRYDHLETALRKYVSNHPQDIEMEFCLAGCLYKRGQVAESQSLLNKIMAARPDHSGAKELSEFIAKSQTAAQTKPAAFKLEISPQLQSSGDPWWNKTANGASNHSTAQTAAEDQPTPMADQYDSQISEMEDNKRHRRFDQVRTGIEALLAKSVLKPAQRERALLVKGEMHAIDGEFDQATGIFDRILASNPGCARAYCGKGAISAHYERWSEAKSHFETALKHDANYDVALAGIGLCAAVAKQSDIAWDYYWRALQRNPENLRAMLGLVELAYPLKKHAELEEALRAYLDLHPADLDFLYALAGCCYAQKNVAAATQEVEKILLLDPGNARATELKGMLHGNTTAASLGAAAQPAW